MTHHRWPPVPRMAMTLLSAAITAALLAGCGGDPDGFDEADTTYATDLTSHHAQTLQLLDLSLGRDRLAPELGALADQTRSATFDEVATSQRWLKKWDQPVPKTALEHSHSDNLTYDTAIPGMLSEQQMHNLTKENDETFGRAWLEQLIAHEQGAVELAEIADNDAQNADVAAFAAEDLRVHRDRVERLEDLLGS